MRAYFFGNMYLSSIQQGIQAAHVVAEMFTKYGNLPANGLEGNTGWNMLNEWSARHKTMILLNAGYGSEIRSLVEMFNTFNNPYPWAHFNEEKDALDGAITSIGIILPESIYETVRFNKSGATMVDPYMPEYDLCDFDRLMIQRLPNYGLAK